MLQQELFDPMNSLEILKKRKMRTALVVIAMVLAVVILGAACLFVGASNMSLPQGIAALFGKGSAAHSRIIWNIRIPRVFAAVIAGSLFYFNGVNVWTCIVSAIPIIFAIFFITTSPRPVLFAFDVR